MAKSLTPAKAKEILHDGTVHGHPITDKQRKFFGAMSNMNAGGWLDKYVEGGQLLQKKEDNYGKQGNYNDAEASFGPDFVGTGYDTTGRNYSPAWGGQFQDGGILSNSNIPTQADSLALYNNAKKVLNYYKNYDVTAHAYIDNTDRSNKAITKYNKESLKSFNDAGEVMVPLKNGEHKWMKIPESMYYKNLDDNKYMQRESAYNVLDTRAPMQLYDRRITPTQTLSFDNTNSKDPMSGDAVNIQTYDPVLVKPVSMLTPEEKNLRLKRYGKTSGIKETILKPTPKPTPKPEPLKEEVKKPAKGTKKFFYNDEEVDEATFNKIVPKKGMAMGGSLPGATGMMYARTQDPAPSNGKYAKKTLASAQDGKSIQQKRYNELYAPIENKVFEAIGTQDNYDRLPISTKDFLDKTIAGFSVASNRNIPPMDPVIKEVQDKVQKLPKEELTKLLNTNWSKVGLAGAMKNTPSSVSYLDMLKYVNHFNELKKKGYTLQNGGEMSFYQNGLDFTPKSISKNGSVIKDDRGQWAHPGEITEIGSNNITMQGVPYPVLGVSDTGDTQMMQPGKDYKFNGKKVIEYPMMQKDGWLNKYK